MTDEKIVKALELCFNGDVRCGECPYAEKNSDYLKCAEYVFKDALDLINRQKAEIERLRDLLHESTEDNNRWVCDCIQMQKDMEKLKAEARKEFAERLKIKSEHFEMEKENFVSETDIDNLLAEMESEKE